MSAYLKSSSKKRTVLIPLSVRDCRAIHNANVVAHARWMLFAMLLPPLNHSMVRREEKRGGSSFILDDQPMTRKRMTKGNFPIISTCQIVKHVIKWLLCVCCFNQHLDLIHSVTMHRDR